jgi:protein-S-isoprenylcysteine O-methyltransferase Ste14
MQPMTDDQLKIGDAVEPDAPAAVRAGRVLFKLRGLVPVPFVILLLLFADPRPWSWAVGLPLILLGEAGRVWGVGYTGGATRARDLRAKVLCTRGPFAYVRNPLYLFNAVIVLGTVVIGAWWPLIAFQPLFYLVYYYLIVRYEEQFLFAEFGEDYKPYAAAVRRLLPRLTPYPAKSGREFRLRDALRNERPTITGQVVILAGLTIVDLVLAAHDAGGLGELLLRLLT